MIIYMLHTTSRAEADACLVNAGISFYPPGSTAEHPVAHYGYTTLPFGPEMVKTGEIDEDGSPMWVELPNTWQTFVICPAELPQATIDLLLPGTVTIHDNGDDGWTGPAATTPNAPAV